MVTVTETCSKIYVIEYIVVFTFVRCILLLSKAFIQLMHRRILM